MSRQAGILVGVGAVIAAAIGGALFLVLSDPVPPESETRTVDAPTPASGEAADGEAESTRGGRRHARVPGGATLFGVVQRAGDDTPAAAQVVRLVGESVGSLEVATDTSGVFRFEVPPGGPYAVEVDAEGYAPIRLPGIALDRSEERDLGTLLLDLAVRVEVHVGDMAGDPIEGARVSAYAAPEMGFGFDWSKAMAQIGQEPVAVAHVDTSAEGVAVFDELASGSWTFVARKEGYAATGKASLRLRSKVEPDPVELHLARGHTLTGRVLDGAGAPIAGALVMGGGSGNPWDLGATPLRARSTTGADGRYELTALQAGNTTLWAAPAGATPAQVVVLRVPDVSEFDIRIRGGGIVKGRVTMKDGGEPVEGATVRAMSWGPSGTRTAEATTDAEGRFAIGDLPEGNVGNVTAEKEGLTQVVETNQAWNPTAFREGAVIESDIQMAPGAILTGQVRGPSGPVAGARVLVMFQRAAGNFDQKQAVADAEGRFRLDTLLPGKYLIQAGAPGLYLPDFPTNWWMALQNGNVPEHLSGETVAGEETTHDVELATGTTVRGRVETKDGDPVAGAAVRATSNNGWLSGTTEPAISDDAGAFLIEGVVPSQGVQITATAKGMVVAPSEPLNMADGNPVEGRIVVMQPLPIVRGRVTTSTGEFPEDAYVQVTAIPDAQLGWNPTMLANAADAERHPVRRDGTYEAPIRWPTGSFNVIASAPGFAPATSDGVKLEEGVAEYTVDVQLGNGLSLSGRVVSDRTGEGIADAHVRVSPVGGRSAGIREELIAMDGMVAYSGVGGGGGSVVVAVTDESGAFRVSGLGAGTHNVSAVAHGFVQASIEAHTPSTGELALPLPPELEITGVVQYGDGTPVVGVMVSAALDGASGNAMPLGPGGSGGSGANVSTDADGRFVLRPLKRGQFLLTVRNNWGGSANVQPFTSPPIAAGATDVRLIVQKGLLIAGRVVDEAGEPVRQCWIWANPVNPPQGGNVSSVNAQVKPDGTFELVGLPTDIEFYSLRFNAQSMGSSFTPVVLEKVKPGTTGLEVVMKSGLKIEGSILDTDGKPLGNAWVMAQPVRREGETAPQGGGNAMLDDQGAFTIGGLQPGTYRLQLQVWSQNGRQQQLVIQGAQEIAAGTSGLQLTATSGATITGTVVDENGHGVAGVNVSAGPVGGGRGTGTRTDENGEFELGGLDDGASYRVRANASGKIGSQSEDVTAGSSGLRLEVRTGVSVDGTVLAADGSPLVRAWVYLQPVDRPDLTQQNARTDAEGRFTAGGLDESATYKVSARIRSGNQWSSLELGTVRGGDSGVELRASE